MRLKRQVGRSPIIALCAAASVTLPAMFSIPIARADNPDDPLSADDGRHDHADTQH